MRALVTRPEEDATPVAELLRARGIEPVIEPLLRIRPRPGALPSLHGFQALLFTSANGVRAFAAAAARRDLPVFAVGDATAACATSAGFADVRSAGGDVEDLARLIADAADPRGGALLHVAGSAIAGDLAGCLAGAGFTVTRAALYDAEPVEAFSPRCATLLASGGIHLALFFSPRTGARFKVLAAALPARLGASVAICLSPAVASAVSPLHWREVRVAASPTRKSMAAALDALLAGRHDPEMIEDRT